MKNQKETLYILNTKIVSESEGITHITKNRKIFWYCEGIALIAHSDISDIICQHWLDHICDGGTVFDKTTGEEITFVEDNLEEFEYWKNTLTLENFLNFVIEVYFSSKDAKITKEYYFEKQEMIRPTKTKKAALFHLMILDRETEKLVEEIDYPDFIKIINHCKQYIKPDNEKLEKYIFLLNDMDITNCFKNGDDKSYITAESEYDECRISIVV